MSTNRYAITTKYDASNYMRNKCEIRSFLRELCLLALRAIFFARLADIYMLRVIAIIFNS